jgi:hypothetical protein
MARAAKRLTPAKHKQAKHAAFYFGAEAQANPETGFHDYRDDIASRYGFGSWSEMPRDLRSEAIKLYHEGRAAEKKASR